MENVPDDQATTDIVPQVPVPEQVAKRPKALLMWSGGFDSTAILATLLGYKNTRGEAASLRQLCRSTEQYGVSTYGAVRSDQVADYEQVRVATVYCEQFSNEQKERQVLARGKVLARLEEATRRHVPTVSIRADYDGRANRLGGIFQQQAMIYYGCSILEDGEDLIVGWHLDDIANGYIERLHRLFVDHATLTCRHSSRLIAPLIYCRKDDVLRIVHAMGLWDCCTTCENWSRSSFRHHCGTCVPCRHLLSAIFFGQALDEPLRRDYVSLFRREVVEAMWTSVMTKDPDERTGLTSCP